MKLEQSQFAHGKWEDMGKSGVDGGLFQLVFAFGESDKITLPEVYSHLKEQYPNAQIVMSSDGGQIYDINVSNDTVSVTALYFEKSRVEAVIEHISESTSFQTGQTIMQKVTKEGLLHVLIISEGLNVNGSDLIRGIRSSISENVTISGGLAGDNMKFVKTYNSLNAVPKNEDTVVVVCFYGENLKIGLGSIGGWDVFGAKRIITKSKGNKVYEIDGEPALDLYKRYLGELASELPGSGLLFPLSILPKGSEILLVRTLLSIDEAEKSITYAGDVPEQSIASLMKANFERVIDGAGNAVKNGLSNIGSADYALLISCVGRKAILKQRIEEEIENIRFILGDKTVISGFYSFGEIGPSGDIHSCYLHNQTMTVTLFKED